MRDLFYSYLGFPNFIKQIGIQKVYYFLSFDENTFNENNSKILISIIIK